MMIRRWACALALVALSLAPAAHAQDAYTIDPVHSSLAFKARHMMVSDVKGFFDTFSGSIKLDAAKRSEERRVGKECRTVCRSRWSPYH